MARFSSRKYKNPGRLRRCFCLGQVVIKENPKPGLATQVSVGFGKVIQKSKTKLDCYASFWFGTRFYQEKLETWTGNAGFWFGQVSIKKAETGLATQVVGFGTSF